MHGLAPTVMCAHVLPCPQAKYGPLTSASPGVQRGGEPLPTFAQLCARVAASKKITVRDVWGLMLTAQPGAGAKIGNGPPPCFHTCPFEAACPVACPMTLDC